MTYMIDQFAGDIAKWSTDKSVVIGPERGGKVSVYFYGGGDCLSETSIRFDFMPNVKRRHRNTTTGIDTLVSFLIKRGLSVGLVQDPTRLGEAFFDYWPHLATHEHPGVETIQ